MSFPITYWYGIRQDFISRERLVEAQEAGFNIIECKYDIKTNKKVLRWCEELGLRAYVWDARMKQIINAVDGWQDLLLGMINDYRDFPALERYYILDEPTNEALPTAERIAKFITEHDREHGFYINLFPDGVFPGEGKYEEHIDNFLKMTGADLLSFDRYCMMREEVTPDELASGADFIEARVSPESREKNNLEGRVFREVTPPTYFDNIERIRNKALEHNIPWMMVILVSEHLTYRHLTEAEIRYEAFSAYAYGASELSYFTYWAPGSTHCEPWKYTHAIINSDGVRDEHYYMVQRINRDLQSIHDGIGGAKHTAVFHVGYESDEWTAQFSGFGGIDSVDGGRFIMGFFEDKAVVMNKDFKSASTAVIHTEKCVEQYSKYTKTWYRLPKIDGGYRVHLEAGDAELIRLI